MDHIMLAVNILILSLSAHFYGDSRKRNLKIQWVFLAFTIVYLLLVAARLKEIWG
ncbi:hypothetical protein TCA2_4591 [Paenibacillus sp. TCA20]|uniref:Uncharacterized protein n=1 Tax=Paenibacillus urinalis TaxID=521520 RepID=A0ABY7XH33_9BACL|nr:MULTISPECIES: hypothetical protein [Paenibacillus]WDI05075.1 hypothetical protein PUW25_26255 [Paenibacillus urinalis]GAK42099.1 hypothetical protein TCA2_4591 [Paenibacillus sp. TCA20]